MSDDRIQSFAEFWPFYVREHAEKRNRLLHFAGTSLAFACLACGVARFSLLWIVMAPLVGYGFAWIGHFVLQKNRPATFTYPVWSFMGDMKLWLFTLLGKMQAEVDRHAGNSLK